MEIIQECVLIYRMETEKEKRIREVCRELGIRAEAVEPEREAAPLGLLAGARGWMDSSLMQGRAPEGSITEEMLVMAGFSDRLLDAFLKKLRQAQAAVSLKAILTPQNAVWNAGQLQAELKREREAFYGSK